MLKFRPNIIYQRQVFTLANEVENFSQFVKKFYWGWVLGLSLAIVTFLASNFSLEKC